MKKIILTVTLAFASLSVFAQKSVQPDLVIKQEITFVDSPEVINIYYVKTGSVYEVFSKTDLNKQNPSKLNKVKDSSFSRATRYEGKRFVKCTSITEVMSLAKSLFNKYKKYVNL